MATAEVADYVSAPSSSSRKRPAVELPETAVLHARAVKLVAPVLACRGSKTCCSCLGKRMRSRKEDGPRAYMHIRKALKDSEDYEQLYPVHTCLSVRVGSVWLGYNGSVNDKGQSRTEPNSALQT